MSVATASDPRLNIDPAQVGAAVGITATTGTDYWFTDAYGVTYTGTPAHLALSTLARRDLTGDVYPDQPAVARGIRATARTLIDWFTSPHADPQHAAEFAALPPMRVCELVVYLCLYGDADTLNKVGPESLHYYTDHLLYDQVPSLDHPMPRLIDQPCRSLNSTDANPRSRLQITATAPDGAEQVAVPMSIEASEDIVWELTVAIPVPVDELNGLLLDPDYFAGDYLADNRELIEAHLDYGDSQNQQGIDVTGQLAPPRDICIANVLVDDAAPVHCVEVELFFAGPDRDTALQTAPLGSRSQAEQFARAGDRIFSAGIAVAASSVHALT